MEFDIKEYNKLLFDEKYKEAFEFKKANIPNKLFKFIYLSDRQQCEYNDNCPNLKLNDIKINNLESEELWLSRWQSLNDPFECNAVYIDDEKLSEKGYPMDLTKKLFDMMKKFYIGSLTTESNLNGSMPMWAHYANNHKGFCIEFSVVNPEWIFPVSYETDRVAIARLISIHVNAYQKYSSGEKLTQKEIDDIKKSNIVLFHSFLIKDKSWEYEKEFRILSIANDAFKNPKDLDRTGLTFKLNALGLKIENVYLGINCEKIYADRIKEIAKKNGFGVKQMYFDNKAENFSLKFR